MGWESVFCQPSIKRCKQRMIDLDLISSYLMFFAPQGKYKVYVFFIIAALFNDSNNNYY